MRKSKKLEIYLKKNNEQNFPNLVKEINMQVQEAQRVQNKMNTNRPTPRHIVVTMPRLKI